MPTRTSFGIAALAFAAAGALWQCTADVDESVRATTTTSTTTRTATTNPSEAGTTPLASSPDAGTAETPPVLARPPGPHVPCAVCPESQAPPRAAF
jgi:hypothetical protein